MPNPPNNNDLQRERVRFLNQSLSLQNIIRQGSVANSSRDNILPAVTSSLPPVTPSVTSTMTNTPTPSITITPSITPTTTLTQTPTITPTISLSPTVTQTPTQTQTPTISLTPTITPTISITPTITPTVTQTPAPLLILNEGDDFLLLGLENLLLFGIGTYEPLNFLDLKLFNGLYNAKQVNKLENNKTITRLERYNYLNYNYSGLTKPIFYILSGTNLTNEEQTWKLVLSSNNTEVGFLQGPETYGNTISMPLSNYSNFDYIDFSQYNFVSGSYFTNKFLNPLPPTQQQTLMIKGLTGEGFNSLSGSLNGYIIYKNSNFGDRYFETKTTDIPYFALLYWNDSVYPNRWSLTIGAYEDEYYTTLSGGTNSNFISISGYNPDPELTVSHLLSVFEPNIRLIRVNEQQFVTTPTPTVTPSITPSPTPTISNTPSLTPTISLTPSLTPTITLTPSITPTITLTPTITITNQPNNIPINTNSIFINGGNATCPKINLTRIDDSISLCYSSQALPYLYTFDAKWEGYSEDWSMPTGSGNLAIGIATRKLVGGSESSFISFTNCLYGTTEAVSPTWVIFQYSPDEYGPVGSTIATNPSQDFNNIPLTGWQIYHTASSITITTS